MELQQLPSTPGRLRHVGRRLGLTEAAYRRALELAELAPDGATWLRLMDRFLLAIGVLFVVAGIAAFFAYNWADLHQLAKFALIELGIVAAVVLAWWRGLDSLPGRAALFAAAFLVGVLLALYGQVYQTGADPYGLFLGWALLIAGWAIIGRQPAIWFLMLVLANLSLILYWTQVLYPPPGFWGLTQILGPLVWLGTTVMDARLGSLVFLLNVAVLVAWEVIARRDAGRPPGLWFPRLVAVGALANVVIGTLMVILGPREAGTIWHLAAPVFFVIFTGVSFWYYRHQRRDLLMLTACLTGAIVIVTTLVGRMVDFDTDTALLLAFLVIAQTAGAAFWLRGVSRNWGAIA
jgi:uncharacterized membrane protein